MKPIKFSLGGGGGGSTGDKDKKSLGQLKIFPFVWIFLFYLTKQYVRPLPMCVSHD